MELSFGLLFLLIAAAAVAWFWQDSLAARERANEEAFDTCRAIGAALLNGTVSFQSIRVVRPYGGALALERTYVFEYTLDGATVLRGFLVMTGQRVETMGLQ